MSWTDLSYKTPSYGGNINALDGARGLAVLFVIAGHTGLFKLKGGGILGVWLFFVLSGFLLATPFVNNPAIVTSRHHLKKYFIRRFNRVVPMYYFVLVLLFLLGKADMLKLGEHLLFIKGDDHLWTIPQEILFYIFLPVIVLFNVYVLRQNKPAIVLSLLLVAVLSNTYLDKTFLSLPKGSAEIRWFFPVFILGMLFSYLGNDKALLNKLDNDISRKTANVVGLAILAILLCPTRYYTGLLRAAIYPQSPDYRQPHLLNFLSYGYPLQIALSFGLLILCILLSRDGLLEGIFSLVPLRAIGIVSYSMYLMHWYVIGILENAGIGLGSSLFVACLLITYALSCITYGLVERTFMDISRRA